MRYLADNERADAERWMRAAAEEAKKALCERDKCGAVIVRDGAMIGAGYNAPPRDDERYRMCAETNRPSVKPKSDRTCCMHAEWRAVMDALRRHPKEIVGGRLYFTRVDDAGVILRSGRPYCTVCSRLALDAGLDEFLLWHEDGIASYPTGEYNRLSYDYMG
ncbi:MAG: deaminase [Patescibacteria group bacterium]|nr:deaminase [Patescibacteria group bacterium]